MDAWRRVAEPVSTVACPEPPSPLFSGDHSTMVAMCRALESQMSLCVRPYWALDLDFALTL